VVTARIADKAITTAKGSPSFVDSTLIADLAVATGKIADKAITTAKGSPSFVDSSLIADASVTEAKAAFLVQSGSVAPPGYFVYPAALTSLSGWPVACPMTSAAGYSEVAVTAATTGSCYVEGGSPGIYAAVMVYGQK
jgi:hypothetical protein